VSCCPEPASWGPILAIPLSCKAPGPSAQVPELSAACGSAPDVRSPSTEPRALSQIPQSLSPTQPGRTSEDFGGGIGRGVVCTSSD